MRFVLLPIELPEWCTLHDALHWAHSRLYPLGFDFEYTQELAIDADYLGPGDGADGAKWRKDHESAQDQLVAHLMTGQLSATAILYTADFEIVDDGTKESLLRHLTGQSPDRMEVPRNAWTPKNVDWQHEPALRVSEGEYRHIWVHTASLMRYLPEPPRTEITVERSGRVFLWESGQEKPKRGRGGRPPTYNWPRFHMHLNDIKFAQGGLPGKQADCERIMLEWWMENFGEEPASSLVRDHIAPYYAQSRSNPQ